MSAAYNDNIRRCLTLTEQMLELADAGDRDRTDASCALLYARVRDTAYQLRRIAEEECEKHKQEGKWD